MLTVVENTIVVCYDLFNKRQGYDMFRELARKNKEISLEECVEILKNEKRGVLSVIGDGGYPYGMPMNHFYNEDDGCIYFHCGKSGHRLDSLKKDTKVSFCVYDSGFRNENEWALNIKSVIIFGRIEIAENIETVVDISARLSRKFTKDEEYISKEIKAFADETILLKLDIEHICGKTVKEA